MTSQRRASLSSRQEPGTSGNVRRCTLSSAAPVAPGRASHASSAVKQRMGASQAVRQENRVCITVRTERRRSESGRSQ